VAQLVPALNAHARPIRIGYGFSMGAYGALRNERLLRLTDVLALSPVNYALTSANIRKTLWEHGFCPERNEGPLLASQELAPVNLQILDPFSPLDWEQGEVFASAGKIRTIRTPFTDHFTIGLMRGSDTLKQIIDLLLDQDFNGINALLNKIRRAAPERAVNLARGSLARGNKARANRLWQRALEKGVKSEVIERAQVSGLVEYGRRHLASCSEAETAGAEHFIEEVALEAPTALRLQRELAHWCMVYSAPKAALGPLRRAMRLAPGEMDGWLALGRALHVSGQTKEALQTLREARKVFGNSEEIKLLIMNLKQAHPRKFFFRLAFKEVRRPGLTPFLKDLVRIFWKR
jgi:tetratricopeptide (TPR) repeat protein